MFPTPVESFDGIGVYKPALYLQRQGYNFRVVHPIPFAPFPFSRFKATGRVYSQIPRNWEYNGFSIEFPRFLQLPRNWLKHLSGDLLWAFIGGKLLALADEFKPDLIWVQPGLPCGWVGRLLSMKLKSVPYVIVVHGMDINSIMHYPKARKKLELVYSDAAKVIAISKRLQEGVNIVARNAICQLIPYGIDPELIAPEPASHPGKNDGKLMVVSISNLIVTKGIEYNLRALSALKNEVPNLHYRIIGDGPDRQRLERLIDELSLTDRVEFLGQMENAQAVSILRTADFFSLPSYLEGFGLVYLEAMASGIPAIGCAGQGISDIIMDGENGFLVAPRQSENLIEIWRKLCHDDTLRLTIGKQGQKTARNCTWDKIAGEYDAVFREVTGKKP